MRTKLTGDCVELEQGTYRLKDKQDKFLVYDFMTPLGIVVWIVTDYIYDSDNNLMLPDDETDFGECAFTFVNYVYMCEFINSRYNVEWQFSDELKEHYIKTGMIKDDSEDLQATKEKKGVQEK